MTYAKESLDLTTLKNMLESSGSEAIPREQIYTILSEAIAQEKIEIIEYIIKNRIRAKDNETLSKIINLEQLKSLTEHSLTIQVLLMQIANIFKNAKIMCESDINRVLQDKIKSLNLTQHNILEKITAFLKLKKRDKKFLDRFTEGYCSGIASLWLYAKWLQNQPRKNFDDRDDYDWFEYVVKLICLWDQDKSKLSKEECEEIERFIQHIEFFQHIMIYLPYSQGELHKILQDTADRKFKRDYSFAASFTLDQLITLLKMPDFIQEDKQIIIESQDHITALFKHDGVFYYFDANSDTGEEKITTEEEAAKLIFFTHSPDIDNYEPSKLIISLGFKMFSCDNTSVTNYPDKKALLKAIKLVAKQNELSATTGGFSSLLMAATIDDLECVEYFLDIGANPNYISLDGTTVLMAAAHNGHAAVVAKLITAKGIGVNQARPDGTTALMLAAYNGHAAVVAELIAAQGIDVNQARPDGTTALMLAAQSGHTAVVTALLAAKDIEVNKVGPKNMTALEFAMKHKYAEVVDALSNQHISSCKIGMSQYRPN